MLCYPSLTRCFCILEITLLVLKTFIKINRCSSPKVTRRTDPRPNNESNFLVKESKKFDTGINNAMVRLNLHIHLVKTLFSELFSCAYYANKLLIILQAQATFPETQRHLVEVGVPQATKRQRALTS